MDTTFPEVDVEITEEAEMASPVEEAIAPEAVVDPAEHALIQKFSQLVEVPSSLQDWYNRFEEDRKYVNETLLMLAHSDVISTNYVYRNSIILLQNLYAKDPASSWKPSAVIGEQDPLLPTFGKTMEIFTDKQVKLIELKRLCRTAVQEASTIGWAIAKLRVQDDYKRDALGNYRNDDRLDNYARLIWLRQRKAAGMIADDSADAKSLADCEQLVAGYLAAKVEADMLENPPATIPPDPMAPVAVDPATGMPMQAAPQMDMGDPRFARLAALKAGQIPEDFSDEEITRYLGYSLELIQQEDFRFDWTTSRTLDIHRGGWEAHRVFMGYDDFGSKFDVTPEEMNALHIYAEDGSIIKDKHWVSGSGAYDSEGPADRKDLEATANMGQVAVWEMWNKREGRVYVWVDGLKRFLQNYIPEHTGRKWYPFYILAFNPVVGRPIPLSDTLLTQPLQDELNTRRTHERDGQRASYPRVLIKQGAMTDEEKAKYEASDPYSVVEVQSPDDVGKAIQETKPLPFNPALYDRTEVRMEFEMMSGVSRNAAGSASSKGELATTAAVANEQMGLHVDFRRSMLEEFIFDIIYDLAFIGIQVFPEENVKAMCGQGAYWPLLNRETMLFNLKLDVRAGSSGKPDTEKRLAVYEQFATIAQTLGLPVNGEALLEEIMYEMGVNDWRRFLMTPEQMMLKAAMGMPSGMPMPGGGGIPPTSSQPRGNAAKTSPTPGDGSDSYAKTGPPSPGSVPGPKI
jgi:hypothetical protein